jgi:hypothetical protein
MAKTAEHRMQAMIQIGPGAALTYTEGHYHGPYGGMQVLPHATIKVGPRARYCSDFSLLSGSAGHLDIDYLVEVEEEGLAELTAKIFAHKTDHIILKEAVILRGARSRGLIKSRVVLMDQAVADITGITERHHRGSCQRRARPCGLHGNRPRAGPRQRDSDRASVSPGGQSDARSGDRERGQKKELEPWMARGLNRRSR